MAKPTNTPTRDQIKRRSVKIQDEWNNDQEIRRRGGRLEPFSTDDCEHRIGTDYSSAVQN